MIKDYLQDVNQPKKPGKLGKLRENDEDSEKIMTIAALP